MQLLRDTLSQGMYLTGVQILALTAEFDTNCPSGSVVLNSFSEKLAAQKLSNGSPHQPVPTLSDLNGM
jgi:hypothetical protein